MRHDLELIFTKHFKRVGDLIEQCGDRCVGAHPKFLYRVWLSSLFTLLANALAHRKTNFKITRNKVSAAGRTRTCNPKLRRLVLYPIELQPRGQTV